jgi:protein gp37
MAYRLQAMGQANYRNGFSVALHENMLSRPLSWRKPMTIFVNSMSDLFHEDVPFYFIQKILKTMKDAHWHTFQILTKRSKRLEALAPKLEWAPNIWMGVSVENKGHEDRIDNLLNTSATVRFLSLEPLLGPLPMLNLKGIDWVIVGGNLGPVRVL